MDIVEIVRSYIPLLSAGKNYKARCPFHQEKTPSFIVSPERQSWRCFGACNEGGDVISFVMKQESSDFSEALKMLAEKAGVELSHISPASQREFGVLYDIVQAAKDFFAQQLWQDEKSQEYLLGRGFKRSVLEEFEIGFAPTSYDALTLNLLNLGYDIADAERAGLVVKTEKKNYIDRFRSRIIFPIHNTFGKVIGFSGRILPQYEEETSMGKYINTPETPIYHKSRVLYGFHKTKGDIRKENEAVIVEGNTDLLALFQDGVKNVVAVSGTALTSNHLEHLKKFCGALVLSFDNDAAGLIASERAIDMAHAMDFSVRIFQPQGVKDPSEFIKKNPGGISRALTRETVSAFDFYFARYATDISERNLKDRTRLILQKISRLKSPLEKGQWLKKLSERLPVSEKHLAEELSFLKKDSTFQAARNEPREKSAEYLSGSRRDKLALEIFSLALPNAELRRKIRDIQTYMPESLLKIAESFFESISLSPQQEELKGWIEMRASLREGEVVKEKLESELQFLSRELKREYHRERQKLLLEKIREKERLGEKDGVSDLLKEFDETAKLIDN